MLLKIKLFFKRHYLAVILSVLLGFLMILPQVIFMVRTGNNYTGINILATDSESNFLSRFQEITEGDWGFSDIFLVFNKSTPHPRPFLEHVIMYRLGRLFFLNTGQSFLFTKFLLPVILFLIIYFFVLLFEDDKKIALITPVGVILWYGVSSTMELKSFLMDKFIITRPSVFSRPLIPVSGIIILFAFLFCFYSYINKSSRKYFWLSGILFGLSFYIYFYTWSFLSVFVFLSLVWFCIKRNWLNLRKILKAIFLSVLVTLPFWFNFYKLVKYGLFSSSAEIVGLVYSNSIVIGKYLIIVLLFYFLNIYTQTIKREDLWFWSCLIVSFFIVLNQQLITHQVLQPGHYHWYIVKPLAITFLILLVFNLIKKKCKKCFLMSVIIFILFGFYLSISQQIFIYFQSKDEVNLHSQRYAPVYNWLNQNTDKNQIIFSGVLDIGQRYLMSCYTHLDEYLYINRGLYPSSFAQNELTFFLEKKLDKITPKGLEEILSSDLKDKIFYTLYGYYYRVTYLDKGETSADKEVQEFLDKYTSFYQQDLESEFKKYPIDYIIWDKQLNPEWNLDNYEFLRSAYKNNDIGVYEFLSKKEN